ncbi:MAG TPA: tetraacyldisaccharide 4'-kinase [Candidatus Angelobacter sp.]|nr:tetraacyldisaccharide 4'-kinase [Candidatus Angelobacter sp.]
MNPFSVIFGMGVALRNALYDRGIFSAHKLACPVISIGNLSVGGAGKTPFVIALGKLLQQRGVTFDVLSRGYGRNSTEVAVVDPNGLPAQFGDEPLLIARELKAPVIVGADRYQAGLAAEKKFSSTLHLLDDGFQHRRLHRDFDIVLLPAEDYSGTLLPVGRLREPVAALERADAIVLPGPIEQFRSVKSIWPVRRKIDLPDISGKLIAFCGIGRPGQFFDGLRAANMNIAEKVAFRDHHAYQQSDIDRLLVIQRRTGADGFITTEKDAINLGPFSAQLQPLRQAGLHMELESGQEAIGGMLKTLEQTHRLPLSEGH